MRIFDLPQKDLETSFTAILDYAEKSIDQWENVKSTTGAFSEFEPTAIIKKPKSFTGQNRQSDTAQVQSALKRRFNLWQRLCIYAILVAIFLVLSISVVFILGL